MPLARLAGLRLALLFVRPPSLALDKPLRRASEPASLHVSDTREASLCGVRAEQSGSSAGHCPERGIITVTVWRTL